MNDIDLRKLIKTTGSNYKLSNGRAKLLLNNILSALHRLFDHVSDEISKTKEK